MFVVQLMFVFLFFHQVMSSGSGRHSLWALASYISGNTTFPEFSVVLMLDDIQVAYFDSETDRLTRVGGGGEEGAELDLGQEAVFILRDIFSSMRKRLALVKHRFNMTAAQVHVQQRLTGCEVLQDGQPALIMFRAGCRQPDTLRHLLDREKRLVTRRVRPRVRFITKQVVSGAQVTCLATDFYPRHINLTLLQDGRPVDESEVTGGSVLPNGNGLYQVRKTLTVSEEELQKKHNYACAAAHLSLDNRLE
ncbi:hypothetical protein L3Q82_012855, partial [Scortum barcoo]